MEYVQLPASHHPWRTLSPSQNGIDGSAFGTAIADFEGVGLVDVVGGYVIPSMLG